MRRQINEARGVPENITSYSKVIFDKVLKSLKNNKFKRQSPFDMYSAVVDAPGKFLKDDKPVKISKIKIKLLEQIKIKETKEKTLKLKK